MEIETIDWQENLARKCPFTIKYRILRLIWNTTYLLCFRISPRPFNLWRRCLLRFFGANVGKGVKISSSARIWAPWNLELKDKSNIGDRVDCYSVGKIVIGKYATISQEVFLCTATHDYTILHRPLVIGKINIQNHTWICSRAIIMPNVNIGEGTVVGSGSIVNKSLAPWKIAVGIPCKEIKDRILKKIIKNEGNT